MIWSSRLPRWYSGKSACRTGLATSSRNSVATVFHSSELDRASLPSRKRWRFAVRKRVTALELLSAISSVKLVRVIGRIRCS